MAPTRSIVAIAVTTLLGISQATYTEEPPCTQPFTPFQPAGCVAPKTNIFPFQSSASQYRMTVETCTAICKGNSYSYAALTYYGVCYCGNLDPGATVPDSQCSYKCSGNPAETCGGPNSFSIWKDPTSGKTPDQVIVGDYQPQGCYTDKGFHGRALGHPTNVDGDLTTEKCISACKAQGFAYAGTEYSSQCWCDSNLNPGSSKAPKSECQLPCSGDRSQTCGGNSRINVYYAPKLGSSEPCTAKPSPASSTLTPITRSSSTVPGSSTTLGTSTSTTVSSSGHISHTPTSLSSTGHVSPPLSSSSTSYISPPPSSSSSTSHASPSPSSSSSSTSHASPPPSSSSTSYISPPPSSSSSTSHASPPPSSSSTSYFSPPPSSSSSSSSSTSTPQLPSSTSSTTMPTTQPPSTQPPSTTTPTTTKTFSFTTSTLCSIEVSSTPTSCPGQIGDWCPPPLPPWHETLGCVAAAAQCVLQAPACLLEAGIPANLECVGYLAKCAAVKLCCVGCVFGCSQDSCAGAPALPTPVVTTTLGPCPTTYTPKPTTSTSPCPPAPTDICVGGKSLLGEWDYGPGNEICGIALPVVSCNNDAGTFSRGALKLYDRADTSQSSIWPIKDVSNACHAACEKQRDLCLALPGLTCLAKHGKAQKRTILPLVKNLRCGLQYASCVQANRDARTDQCQKFCQR